MISEHRLSLALAAPLFKGLKSARAAEHLFTTCSKAVLEYN